MARDDSFAVMDVATNVALDPKFKRLSRLHPELLAPAFMAYIGLLGESWSAGSRVAMDDGWPPILPFEVAAVDALKEVGLLDKTAKVPAKAWSGWFSQAKVRRDHARERWRRANVNRRAVTDEDTASVPRGNSDVTGAFLPSVPTVPPVPSVPTDSGGGGKPGVGRARGSGSHGMSQVGAVAAAVVPTGTTPNGGRER